MSAYDILGYVFTSISFLTVIYSVFSEQTRIFACVLVLLSLISFFFSIWHLMVRQNKTHTLQVLSKENRATSIRLLLTYERLKYSKDELSAKFCPPKFYVSKAYYSYKIIEPNGSSKNKDLECTFNFQFTKAPKKGSFDVLISQPRGDLLKTIKYRFNDSGEEYTTTVEKIVFKQKKTDFYGLWRSQISWNCPEGVYSLTVSYTLKQVYRTDGGRIGAFLLCPFMYGKKIENLDILVRYPNNAIYKPQSIALKLYPYDGRRCRPEKVHDFSDSEDSSIWEIKNLRCVTNAIYIIELYH